MVYPPGVINNSIHYEMKASYINERNELKEVKLHFIHVFANNWIL
jgi:hypothetical protein